MASLLAMRMAHITSTGDLSLLGLGGRLAFFDCSCVGQYPSGFTSVANIFAKFMALPCFSVWSWRVWCAIAPYCPHGQGRAGALFPSGYPDTSICVQQAEVLPEVANVDTNGLGQVMYRRWAVGQVSENQGRDGLFLSRSHALTLDTDLSLMYRPRAA